MLMIRILQLLQLNRTAGDDNIVTQTANLTLLSKTPNGSNDTVIHI
jgi:hypothetical protein